MYIAIGHGDRIISRHRKLSRAALAVALEGHGHVMKEGVRTPAITDVVYAVDEVLQRWDAVAFLRIGNGHWTTTGLVELLDILTRHGRPVAIQLRIGTKVHRLPDATIDELVAAAESSVVIRREDIA